MKKNKIIIPAVIAKSQNELEGILKRVKGNSWIQLDVMDGLFVKTKSLNFDFRLPRTFSKFEAHLMIRNPERWITKHWKKVQTIIFHYESTRDIERIIKLIKKRKRKVGIAINPKTSIEKIMPYLRELNLVLIMTVNPGKYGSKFVRETLKKVRELRRVDKKIQIEVDGGINPETIKEASLAGADCFVSGSYIIKSKNVREAIKNLKESIK